MTSQAQARPASRHFTDEQMKRYFAKVPGGVIAAIVIGGALALCGIATNATAIIVIGAIVALICVAIIVSITGGSKPTDAEYDQWLEEQAQLIFSRAPAKLGLDPSQITRGEPLQVHGFILPGTRGARKYRADEIRWKVGRDGITRFSINVYTYFFPGDHHLATFVGDINALNQAAHNEKAEEYFYRDIVGVTANDEQDYVLLQNKQYQYRIQEFSLKVSNGDAIGVSVGAVPVDNRQNIPNFQIPNSGIDRTLAQLRMVLREKRQSNM